MYRLRYNPHDPLATYSITIEFPAITPNNISIYSFDENKLNTLRFFLFIYAIRFFIHYELLMLSIRDVSC